MELTIIRHGKTQGNIERRYIGCRTDEPLTEEGKAELKEVRGCAPEVAGESQREAMLFVSPMIRARETAAILFPGAEQHVIDDLREMDFGIFEGKNYQDLNGDQEYQAWIDSGCTSQIPGGEIVSSFNERSMNGLRQALKASVSECREAGSRAEEPHVYIVAHGGTVMAVMSTLTGEGYYDFYSANGCGFTIELEVDNAGNITSAGTYDRFCGGVCAGSSDR